jgi:hypothetical protein
MYDVGFCEGHNRVFEGLCKNCEVYVIIILFIIFNLEWYVLRVFYSDLTRSMTFFLLRTELCISGTQLMDRLRKAH